MQTLAPNVFIFSAIQSPLFTRTINYFVLRCICPAHPRSRTFHRADRVGSRREPLVSHVDYGKRKISTGHYAFVELSDASLASPSGAKANPRTRKASLNLLKDQRPLSFCTFLPPDLHVGIMLMRVGCVPARCFPFACAVVRWPTFSQPTNTYSAGTSHLSRSLKWPLSPARIKSKHAHHRVPPLGALSRFSKWNECVRGSREIRSMCEGAEERRFPGASRSRKPLRSRTLTALITLW